MTNLSIVNLWEIENRENGGFWAFSNSDIDITIGKKKYIATPSIDVQVTENKLGLGEDNTVINTLIDSEIIKKDDIDRGVFVGAVVRGYSYDLNEPSKSPKIIFNGLISEVQTDEIASRFELNFAFDKLNHVMGRAYHRTCDARLGDKRCGVDINSSKYQFETKVLEINSSDILVRNPNEVPSDIFQNGFLILGDAVLPIRQDDSNSHSRRLSFWNPVSHEIEIGQEVTLQMGCDYSLNCCKTRFSNVKNFCGFPHIPNDDWLKVKTS